MTKPYSPELLIELRAAVAEIMGYALCENPMRAVYPCYIMWGSHLRIYDNALSQKVYKPDIDPAQGMAVLKKCGEKVGQLTIYFESGECCIGQPRTDADWFPVELGICIFALRLHKPDHPVLKKLK